MAERAEHLCSEFFLHSEEHCRRPHVPSFLEIAEANVFLRMPELALPPTAALMGRIWQGAGSSAWLERTPDKREVGSSSLPRPTIYATAFGRG